MTSVIICHHKGTLLDEALRTVLRSKGIEFEVIVVTSMYLTNPVIEGMVRKYPSVRFIQMDGGPDVKRNHGAKFAHYQHLAFFDDDVEVEEWALYEMKRLMDKRKVQMVFGKSKNMEYRNRFDEAGSYLTWSGFLWARAESGVEDTGQFEKEEPILAGKSVSCMIERALFFRIGGFDTTFEILGEETDLAWRVWLMGGEVWWCPKSVVWHAFNTRYKPRDFYTNERIYFNGCRNYITMLIKNLGSENLWIVPVHTLVWCVAAVGMLLSGKFLAGRNILRGVAYVGRNLPRILRQRRELQQKRVLRDSELFSLVLRGPTWGYYLHRLLRYWKIGLHG